MVLGDLGRTRRLAGNPSTSNVSDADVTAELTFGTAQVIRQTGKTDWETDINHPSYPSAVQACEYYGSAAIRDRFDDQRDVSTEHWNRANMLVEQISQSIDVGTNLGGMNDIAIGVYRSNPLNPSAFFYRGMGYANQGQELIGVTEYQYRLIPQ
jgi:hypothetical protein